MYPPRQWPATLPVSRRRTSCWWRTKRPWTESWSKSLTSRLSSPHSLISAVGVVQQSRSARARLNFNSARGIDPKYLEKLFQGFHAKIEHDMFSKSTYQLAKTIMHTFTNKKIKSFSTDQISSIRKVYKNLNLNLFKSKFCFLTEPLIQLADLQPELCPHQDPVDRSERPAADIRRQRHPEPLLWRRSEDWLPLHWHYIRGLNGRPHGEGGEDQGAEGAARQQERSGDYYNVNESSAAVYINIWDWR